jgi:hypothetical protein
MRVVMLIFKDEDDQVKSSGAITNLLTYYLNFSVENVANIDYLK